MVSIGNVEIPTGAAWFIFSSCSRSRGKNEAGCIFIQISLGSRSFFHDPTYNITPGTKGVSERIIQDTCDALKMSMLSFFLCRNL